MQTECEDCICGTATEAETGKGSDNGIGKEEAETIECESTAAQLMIAEAG
jgi:hypothetical protein